MPKAVWNGEIIAESDDTVIVEGNHYFPRESVRAEFLRDSDTHTICPWKGTASYQSLEVNGKVNRDALWYYPEPKDEPDGRHRDLPLRHPQAVRDRVAFWKGVEVS
mgnify:CR=1 FL=1